MTAYVHRLIAVAPPDQATTWLNSIQAQRFPERAPFTEAELADFLDAAVIWIDQPLEVLLTALGLQRIAETDDDA